MFSNLIKTLRLTLLNMEYCKVGTYWNYKNVVSPFSRLYLITEGKCRVYHHGQKFELEAGVLHLIPGFTSCSYQCDHPFEQYYIHFIAEMDSQLPIHDAMAFNYDLQSVPEDAWLFKRLLQLNPHRELPHHDPKVYQQQPYVGKNQPETVHQNAKDMIETQGILLQLFSRFFKQAGEFNPNSLEKFRRFGDLLQYIHNNFHQKVSLQQLADRACLAPDYFSRLFCELTGFRPIEYVNRKRIEKSQLLLITTYESQEAIAQQTGFNSLSYFSRTFKKYTGTTPDEYRKQHLTF